jgi:hypothetical protein
VLVEVQEVAVVVIASPSCDCRKGPWWQRWAHSLCMMEMKGCGFDHDRRGGSSAHCHYITIPTLPFSPTKVVDTTTPGRITVFDLFLHSNLPEKYTSYNSAKVCSI